MKLQIKSTVLWAFLLLATVACVLQISISSHPYAENIGYHTFSRQTANQINTEEHLIINEEAFTLTAVENTESTLQTGTITAEILESRGDTVQIKIRNFDLSDSNELFQSKLNPGLFFKRQYALQEGSILSYEFFETSNDETICFFIHELERLRCMSN